MNVKGELYFVGCDKNYYTNTLIAKEKVKNIKKSSLLIPPPSPCIRSVTWRERERQVYFR